MRRGIIDIGTNTVRLLILDFDNHKVKELLRKTVITRLGEGVNRSKVLKESAMARTLEIIKKYQKMLNEHKVEEVRVAATSAVREAKNSFNFISKVREEAGLDVEILSGREEGRLAFLGAISDVGSIASEKEKFLVIDIGGGSTELISGSSKKVEFIYSLKIGSVRLMEMFLKKDPPDFTEMERARWYVQNVIKEPLSILKKSQYILLGVAGTITTISAVHQGLKRYNPEKVHHSCLSQSDVEKVLRKFLRVPLEERKKIDGLEPARADIIIAGTLILLEVMRALKAKKIIVSEKDLLDGLALSY